VWIPTGGPSRSTSPNIFDGAAAFAALTNEITRRQGEAAEDQVPIYVLIYDIQRFRDLRKADDDFGFSSRSYDDAPQADPPSKMFLTVLRDGPPVGIHTIVWCDSVNNLQRTFDRSGTREFENRIMFQMSSNDSSTLIDSPAASKLGENRALYYSEEENRVEKFRPYGLPEAEWLEQVKARFASRPVPEVAAASVGNRTSAASAPEPVRAGDGAGVGDGGLAPAGVGEAGFGDGNGASAHGDGNGLGDIDGPDRWVESHAPAPSGDEPGGPPE